MSDANAINETNYYGAGCGVMDRGSIKYGDYQALDADGNPIRQASEGEEIGVGFYFLESKSREEVSARRQELIQAFAKHGIAIEESLNYYDGGVIRGAFDADGTYGIATEEFIVENLPASALPAVSAVVKELNERSFDLKAFMDANDAKYRGPFEKAMNEAYTRRQQSGRGY